MLFPCIPRPQSRPCHQIIPTTSTYGEFHGRKDDVRPPRTARRPHGVEVWQPPNGRSAVNRPVSRPCQEIGMIPETGWYTINRVDFRVRPAEYTTPRL